LEQQDSQQIGNAELTFTAATHASNPSNYGRLPRHNGHARITGPCGDTMEFWLQVSNGKIHACTFITDGCGPSLASGSVATELAVGKGVEQALQIRQKDVLEALGGLPRDAEHCALLSANTLQAACRNYQERYQTEGREIKSPARAVFGTGASGDRVVAECETCSRRDCSAKEKRQGETDQDFADRQRLHRRLCRIEHKVLVLSGKGGVGKSTVAVNLAVALMGKGKCVGLLDVDIHGPSVPIMLALEGEQLHSEGDSLLPVEMGDLKVMSIGFLLRRREEAVIWRGPMKMGVIKQFLKDVEWGNLDYLIVDAPPGTGDEPLSVCQLIEDADGAIIVTTPQEVALASVRKSITFCRQLNLRVLGVVENMSGFICPHCGMKTEVFLAGGGERMAREMKVPFLGRIPLEECISRSGDNGRPFVHAAASRASGSTAAFEGIVRSIVESEPAGDVVSPVVHQ
jgi:ATP-binding protein involved in chromosome partitioning